MSQRRYYVLSAQGEIGPHNRLEIRDLLDEEAISEHDELRTAGGNNAGTVFDLLSKPEESSSYRLATVEVIEPGRTPALAAAAQKITQKGAARHRHDTDPGGSPASAETVAETETESEPRPVPVVTLALGATLLVLLVGWWLLSSGERHREARESSAAAALPVVTISGADGSWVLGHDARVTIRTAQPVTQTLTVHLAVTGSAIPGVDFTAFPTQVEIPAGADVAQVPCQPLPVTNGRQPAVIVTVAIAPHAGYQLGAARKADVVLRSEETEATQAGHAQVTWVGDLPFVVAWSAHHQPNRNQSHDQRPMAIDQVNFTKGLAIHPGDHAKDPEAHVTFALDGRFEEFLATVGLDDEVRNQREPSVAFKVWVDGQPQFDSGIMRANTPARTIRINVAGAKILRLVVTDGGDGNVGDHANWGGARLLSK